MLSYDSPASPGGQAPASPTNMAHMQSMPTSPKAVRNGLAGPKAGSTTLTDGYHGHDATQHHIWLVTGPAGCGKSTVAKHIADTLHLPYVEGDDFHPPANIEKMRNGVPLTDADRWDWLTALREESLRQLQAGNDGVVLTCSALKRKYRDVIRVAPYFSRNVQLHFIFLDAPEEVLLSRVASRQGHYMGANMVHSQFEVLERPTDEETDVIRIDVSRTIDEVKQDALSSVLAKMDEKREDEN